MPPATNIGRYFNRVQPLDLSGYERMPISIQSFINRDYINPTDRRPMVSGAIFCPILETKMSADGKKTTQLYFFSSADSYEVSVSGLTSADRRPTIGRSSVDNRPTFNENNPFKLGRLLADHRPTIGRQSADDLL